MVLLRYITILSLNIVDYIAWIQSSMDNTFDAFEESISYLIRKNN